MSTDCSRYPFASKVVATADAIKNKTDEVAGRIAADYKGLVSMESPLLLLIVLKGAFVFGSDLSRALSKHGLPVQIEFIQASSYGSGTTSSGSVEMKYNSCASLKDRHVMVVEDILDSANTLVQLKKDILLQTVASLKFTVLLDKPGGRKQKFEADYECFSIDPEFVVGYGLDYNEKYRELNDVVVLKPEVYA